jgi:hypothetical protein
LDFSPGDVKEFSKKIDLENRRIELRKKTLRQQQEKLEAMKAAATPTPPPASASGDVEMKPPESDIKPPVESSTSSVHPSLPAKPGTANDLKLQESNVSAAQAEPAVTAAPSAPPPLPKDAQITRAEEVCNVKRFYFRRSQAVLFCF